MEVLRMKNSQIVKNYFFMMVVGLSTLVVGCASVSKKDVQDRTAKLKSGLTPKEVLTVMGTPEKVIRGEELKWVYTFDLQNAPTETWVVYFQDGTVVSAEKSNGRVLASQSESEQSGQCTRWPHRFFVESALCYK